MAEAAGAPAAGPGGAGLDIKRLLLVGAVGLIISIAFLFLVVRGCASTGGGGSGYNLLYTNLELKDAANVVAGLKEMAITYEIRDGGRSIAVPKNKIDQARLGLAENNLPAGGVVGWEIFDESKLGATDFDRRIQLIRAISGELSRTIRRISAIEDARVQIVMPESKLFETVKAPVTASVMLRLRPGAELTPGKIRGIVHLVSSSVENLQPQNVTVVDSSGRILTTKAILNAPEKLKITRITVDEQRTPAEKIIETRIIETSKDMVITPEVEKASALTKLATVAALTSEEKMMLKVKAKKKLELNLAGKAQEILNRFYPPNSVIIKLNIDFKNNASNKSKAYELKVKKLTAIILVDNRIDISKDLKQSTYKAVAAAIGYSRKRGDRIILQKVPFHLATPPPEVIQAEVRKVFPDKKPDNGGFNLPISGIKYLPWIGGGLFSLLLAYLIMGRIRRKPKGPKFEMSTPRENIPEPSVSGGSSEIEALKSAASSNPEKIAELMKNWLTE
jgi:flagellar M-ring protein FliF